MKFKIDENMPHTSLQIIERYGHEAHSMNFENLIGTSDKNLLKKCKGEKRILVTCDDDFIDTIKHPKGSYYGIIYFHLRKKNRDSINNALNYVLDTIDPNSFVDRRVLFIEELFEIRIEFIDN